LAVVRQRLRVAGCRHGGADASRLFEQVDALLEQRRMLFDRSHEHVVHEAVCLFANGSAHAAPSRSAATFAAFCMSSMAFAKSPRSAARCASVAQASRNEGTALGSGCAPSAPR